MRDADNNWDEVSIADLGQIVAGGTPSRAVPSFWNGSIPWITPSEITKLDGKYVEDSREKITEEGLAGSAARLLPVGSILVTTRATLGEVAIAAVPLATNQGFKSIIPNSQTDPLFAYYRVGALRPEMKRLASGTTFLEISKADFARIRTRRPKPFEQARIAASLNAVDEAIAKTEAVIPKLKQVRAGLHHDLLSYGLDENGELRDPDIHPELFREEAGFAIPKPWAFRCLRQCLTSDPQNGLYKPAGQIGEGTLLIGQTSITEDRTIDVSKARRAKASEFEVDKFGLRRDEILVSRVFATLAGVGLPAIVPALVEKAVYESNMMRLKVDATVIMPRILFEQLRTERTRSCIVAAAQLSNQASINQPALNRIPICIAQSEEHQEIARRIIALDEALRDLLREHEKLCKLKSGLMTDLLTGCVPVPQSLIATEAHA